MKIRASLLFLAAVLASPVMLAAEGHVLARKGSLPLPGKSVTEKMVQEMNDAELSLAMGEQKLGGTVSSKEVTNEVTEGISPVKARRILTSKTSEYRMIINNQEQPAPEEADPLQGLPVILEEKDGKWAATLEKGEATADQTAALEELARERNEDSDFAIYGDTPRKPGEKWEVDVKKLPSFGGASDLKGSFVVEFVEVKEINGSSCAVLKSTVDLTGASAKEGDGPTMSITLKGEAVTHRSLTELVDLESKLTATMTVKGKAGEGVDMKISGPVTMNWSATVGER